MSVLHTRQLYRTGWTTCTSYSSWSDALKIMCNTNSVHVELWQPLGILGGQRRLWRRLRRCSRLWLRDCIRSCAPSARWNGRSRRRRDVTDVNVGVGPDASTGTSYDWLGSIVSSSSPDSPSTVSAVESSASTISRVFAQKCATAIILWTSHPISISYSFGTNAVGNAVIVWPFDWTRTRTLSIQRSLRPYLCHKLNWMRLNSVSSLQCRSSL